jgi:plastocyanin
MRKLFVLAIAAALLLAACGGDDDDSGSASKAPVQLSGKVNDKGTKTVSGSSIELEADDFYFSPTFIEAKPGAKVEIEIKNEGSATHNFSIDSANINKDITPDGKATVEVTVPASGSLDFYCKFHKASGMQGAIVAKS